MEENGPPQQAGRLSVVMRMRPWGWLRRVPLPILAKDHQNLTAASVDARDAPMLVI